jgi:hypothetical protein
MEETKARGHVSLRQTNVRSVITAHMWYLSSQISGTVAQNGLRNTVSGRKCAKTHRRSRKFAEHMESAEAPARDLWRHC